MMNEINLLTYGIVALMGFAMGCLFFVSLWWTIQRMKATQSFAVLFVLSFVLRMALVLVGFYLLAGGYWQRLIVALIGFTVARFVIVNYYRRESPHREEIQGEHSA